MAPIQLRDAARHFRDLPHQLAAFDWLQEQLTNQQLDEFAVLFRAAGSGALPAPPAAGDAIGLALPLIKVFEGIKLESYPDPLSGCVPWTIGWGTTQYPCGGMVRPGDRITRAQADEYMRWWVEQDEIAQAQRIPTWSKMSANQQAAILSFSYNFGRYWYNSHGFATLTRNLRDEDWAAVPETLLLYRNPHTHVEAGLLRRRQAEGRLFSGLEWA
jgi:GH24 family phage-related lysozyme (muramidase)